MELILIFSVVGLIILLSFLKTKISDQWQLIVACVAGFILLIWFWGFENGETRWKILSTVLVTGSIFNQVRRMFSTIRAGVDSKIT